MTTIDDYNYDRCAGTRPSSGRRTCIWNRFNHQAIDSSFSSTTMLVTAPVDDLRDGVAARDSGAPGDRSSAATAFSCQGLLQMPKLRLAPSPSGTYTPASMARKPRRAP